MLLPNYKDGSIVNLMSSIAQSYNIKTPYSPLKQLDPKELKKSQNIMLLVVDGLGYEYLKKQDKETILNQYCRDKITTVFPTTTAAAITTFFTGLAPQQHAMTGWFVYMKEVGTITVPLRGVTRIGHLPLGMVTDLRRIYDQKPLFERWKVKSYTIHPEDIAHAHYNSFLTGNVKKYSYRKISGLFKQAERIIKSNRKDKFIYAYWPDIDSFSHKYGNDSRKVRYQLSELNKKLALFLKKIRNTNTTIIITADHGQITTKPKERINLNKHPKLRETFILPLSGDSRVAYCYVYPKKAAQFRTYIKKHLSRYCTLHKSEDLIKRNYFGLFKQNSVLKERIGNYVLMMKKNYVIRDFVPGEKVHFNKGNHSGLTKEELFVPLIVINGYNLK